MTPTMARVCEHNPGYFNKGLYRVQDSFKDMQPLTIIIISHFLAFSFANPCAVTHKTSCYDNVGDSCDLNETSSFSDQTGNRACCTENGYVYCDPIGRSYPKRSSTTIVLCLKYVEPTSVTASTIVSMIPTVR